MHTHSHLPTSIMEQIDSNANSSGGSGSGGGGSAASSRWNPTKEQISMLEGLYMQGIRTPNAEQIQEITSRLKVFGHIEGKNVFYWFQNHKARQRQKQKQHNLAVFNRYLHKSHPIFYPSTSPNVVYNPYFLPHTELGFYPQYPKMILPGNFRRKSTSEKMDKTRDTRDSHKVSDQMLHSDENSVDNISTMNNETLSLFPLHPSGTSSIASTSAGNSESLNCSAVNGIEEGFAHQPFFDFFSGPATSCDSD